MKDCVIVAGVAGFAAAPQRARLLAADLLIAADGGALPLMAAGIRPHVLVGDLDSLDAAQVAQLAGQGVEVQRFPPAKDETDLELAIMLACARGAQHIDIYGALGGRWDHTLANVALLALPELAGRRVRLLDADQELYLVRSAGTIEGAPGDTVSLIPLAGAAAGVTTRGLHYALDDATLYVERSRGVSNILVESPAHVTVRAGLLLVVHHRLP